MTKAPLLSIEGAERVFGAGSARVHALQGVTLDLHRGETLGVVGESGCGKSTLARLLVGLDRPTGGRFLFDGRDLAIEARRNPRALAGRIQYVFQDPIASLNPRKTVRRILEAPLIHLCGFGRAHRAERLEELMEAVNLAPEFLDRYPHEFSGGQAQRIAIARALAADPEVIVLDEPVSALDVSVQAQVLNLLDALKARYSFTYLFISHDLSVIETVSDRIAVLYFGRVAELGPARRIFARPRHPYTHLLLDSVPAPGRRTLAPGDAQAELPDPFNPPPGCPFYARCPRGTDRCVQAHPSLEAAPDAPDHRAACWHPHQGD